MTDKNSKEKKILKDFAADRLHRNKYKFPEIDLSADSYYICRGDDQEYIREYDFDTAPELRKELEYLWKDDNNMAGLIQPMIVAALKNKPLDENLSIDKNMKSKQTQDQSEKLLAYIYNF